MLIPRGRYATCGVEINGVDLGVKLFTDRFELAPYLKEGENRITLSVCFSLRNLLGPHHGRTSEPMFIVPRSFSFEKQWDGDRCENFRHDYSFVKWGLGF